MNDLNEAIIETLLGVQAQVTVLQQLLVGAGITTDDEIIERSKRVLDELKDAKL